MRYLNYFLISGMSLCFFLLSVVPTVFSQENGRKPEKGELLINELLYEAVPADAEYIELYNSGTKEIALREIYIGKRNEAGELVSVKQVTTSEKVLEPGALVWMCSNYGAIEAAYTYCNTGNCIVLPTKLAYSDSGGTLVVLNRDREVIDEMTYGSFLHHPMVKRTKGVALEKGWGSSGRQGEGKWTSAGGNMESGYGSPGMPNRAGNTGAETIGHALAECIPEVFTPNGDGLEDELEIKICVPDREVVLQLLIYDTQGRLVRRVADEEPVYSGGKFYWDGTTDNGRLLPAGIYIVYVCVVHPDGNRQKTRKVCVLSR